MSDPSPTETPGGHRIRSIELLGLPGAGKSTLVDLVGQRPGALTVPDLVRRERLRQRPLLHQRAAIRLMPLALKLRVLTGPVPDAKDAASFVLAHPSHLDSVMRASQQVGDEANRGLAVALLFESWAERAFAARVAQPGESVLFDEAVLQRLVFLMALLPSGAATDDLIGSVPMPDAVVLLDLPLDLATSRVRGRARGFQLVDVMQALADRVAELVAELEHHGVPLLVIDATRPASHSVRDLGDFLERT